VLTLRLPKAGLEEEKAVIPSKLAGELKFYLRNHTEEQKVIVLSWFVVFDLKPIVAYAQTNKHNDQTKMEPCIFS